MLETIKKLAQIPYYKFWKWCKKISADIIACYQIEVRPFSSQLYKMITFKDLELAAKYIH